jgi:hypothetical protein
MPFTITLPYQNKDILVEQHGRGQHEEALVL